MAIIERVRRLFVSERSDTINVSIPRGEAPGAVCVSWAEGADAVVTALPRARDRKRPAPPAKTTVGDVMRLLYSREVDGFCLKEMAARLGVESHVVLYRIKVMRDNGLVARFKSIQRTEHTQKACYLYRLTPRGRAIFENKIPAPEKVLPRTVGEELHVH